MDPNRSEGPAVVREFAGAIGHHPFSVGILVTNTSFTPDAKWFAQQHRESIRLRGFQDIRRWLLDTFDSEEEWREIPDRIELCPGTVVEINPRKGRAPW